MNIGKGVLPWTESVSWARNEFTACNVNKPESSDCTDLMVSDMLLLVELNAILSFQLLDMSSPPGNIITIISLLKIHAPATILAWLESVTLLPTGRGF